MNDLLRFARERIVLDLGRVSAAGGAEVRPATWDDVEPDGGPTYPPPPVGTVLEAAVIPATDDDGELHLPRRVVCRPDGRWASLPPEPSEEPARPHEMDDAEPRKPKQRTDEDYIRLDAAIATICDWLPEIVAELNKKHISERTMSEVLDAMQRVHSPEE